MVHSANEVTTDSQGKFSYNKIPLKYFYARSSDWISIIPKVNGKNLKKAAYWRILNEKQSTVTKKATLDDGITLELDFSAQQ